MSRPVQSVLTVLLALSAIKCDTVYRNANAPFKEAVKLCDDLDGNLPLPRSQYENDQLASRLHDYGINETWLNAELQLFPWTSGQGTTRREIRDQGCYSGDTFEEAYAFAGYRFTRSRCLESCRTRQKKYYGIKTSTFAWGDEIACMCGDDMTVYQQVGQKLCPWECGKQGEESWCTTDRFYTWISLIEGDETEDGWSETEQEFLSNVETCGKYVRREYIGADQQYEIRKSNCSATLDVYCYLNYGGTVLAPERMSWQRAHSFCESRDAHLPDISEANRLYSVEADSELWTSITARHWLDRQSATYKELEFSNWADQNSYSDVSALYSRDKKCAVLKSDDSWEAHHCDIGLNSFICETHGADVVVTFSTTTHSTTTKTTTTTTTLLPITQPGDNSTSMFNNSSNASSTANNTSKPVPSGEENQINTGSTKKPVDYPQQRRDGLGSRATYNNYSDFTLWLALLVTVRPMSVWITR